MRVVALISGGKDSCYSAMQCVAVGHTLAALANLLPEGKEDELDSYMFQTVGHEAVELMAEAMDLPLYRATTRGRSKQRGLQYSPQEGDEVEDLYDLLERVQSAEDVEGVASGAVLSDYQRLRVEHVCGRLGLSSLAYLWRRDQTQLLTDMTAAGLSAILVKVASIGLTEAHLGQTLLQMLPHLTQLHRQYGVHVCGEGGEYETITLDCPLFSHRIVIDDSEVIVVTPDDVAPVAYLKLKRLHLEKKFPCVQRPVSPMPPLKITAHIPHCPAIYCGGGGKEEEKEGEEEEEAVHCGGGEEETKTVHCDGGGEEEERLWRWRMFEETGGDISQQVHHVFSELSGWLEQNRAKTGDVALCHLFLSSMDHFALLNLTYATFFPSSPPARVCVQLSLPPRVLVRLEVLLCPKQEELVAMHVQSLSHWAPANIGPYSQAVRVGQVVFLAGQIGLDPATMILVPPSQQPSLALRHVECVLGANHTHLTSALCGVCYYTTEEAGWAARMSWTEQCKELGGCGPAVVFLRVAALPRGACVEWSFVALTSPPTQLHHQSHCEVKDSTDVLTSDMVTWCDDSDTCPQAGVWLFTNTPPQVPLTGMYAAVKTCIQELRQQLAASGVAIGDVTQLRFFLPHYTTDISLSYDKLCGLCGTDAVTATTCEGYYGQNCSISLLALLLPHSSHSLIPHITM